MTLVYVIKQKPSGVGAITDIASQYFDRHIVFPNGHKFAVVLAAHYGDNIYSTHATAKDAAAQWFKTEGYARGVIDTAGRFYDIEQLV